ncbi:MAG: hypothetical protein Q8P50_12095, partial [Bacillota bacterium]|nr:hypothetical protein [Bacillota bacterium]
KVLGIRGTKLTLDGEPFFFQGLAFFNALHNPSFNRSEAERLQWLHKFKANGISCLRIWCQWDFPAPRIFTDVGPECSMYAPDGQVREHVFERLAALLEAADSLNMVVEVSMFAHEKIPYFLPIPAQERAVRELTERLRPYGNLFQQIWSEDNTEWQRYYDILKNTDPDRITTVAPGSTIDRSRPFDHIGDDLMNKTLDVLTPHTLRTEAYPFWYIAPAQIEYLLDTYKKPVIDDSPARHGPRLYGGIEGGTTPQQHIEHIRRDRAVGGYHNYLHDMFQYGFGHELTPPSGIPDPDFSPFHREVFDYLRDHPTW